MDTQRLILFFVFSFSILMLWEAWQKDERPAETNAPSVPATTLTPVPTSKPKASFGLTAKQADSVPNTSATASRPKREVVHVTTSELLAEVDTLGGDIVSLAFREHKDADDKTKNFVLLTPEYRYSVQSGLIGEGLPNHKTLFSAPASNVSLAPGKDVLEVRLEAAPVDGLKVVKILTFHRGSHRIEISYDITNDGAKPLAAHAYFQITRNGKAPPGDTYMMSTYTGAAVYTEHDKYIKVSFSDIDKGKTPYSKTADNGWIGMVQHYFVTALLPQEKQPREFYTRKLGEDYYSAGVIVPTPEIAPGATQRVSMPLYAGPQEQDKLKAIAPGLDLVVDYGWLTVIAAPLFWVLQFFHKLLNNWGLAIILLTVVIKLIFFPLSAASYRSMAKMKLVAPRLTKLREQYGDDKVKMNQAMMDLYKTEKINPLGGCLPIVVQIPVFIALYWVLLAAVELRHAPFYGWIVDLASPDPWYVLPALMMVSMIVQTKLNPTPPDPVQAKVMMIMPFAFGVMFFFFPAGLVLYWFVNNILSILQQWQITRMMGDGKTAARR
ncbi:MAG: membrane protein insertase YidC [Betaproteobacteria bacterium RIFCSPLOWO2_12_FULL_63_13]|nr:MAG: membrane protein insertase YidC [Betaproteobacteria bacterium RIFCSPLOWO2_02_FULL_63_19]OGA46937.1 MAG: membrane protein insertase YidC [Betaproteobacteria bacterium RIFCSPLOWO2_12_FULL_63_13]